MRIFITLNKKISTKTYFQTKRKQKRQITTNKIAPITGPMIMSISVSFPALATLFILLSVGWKGLGLEGSSPIGAGRMSNDMCSENGEDV